MGPGPAFSAILHSLEVIANRIASAIVAFATITWNLLILSPLKASFNTAVKAFHHAAAFLSTLAAKTAAYYRNVIKKAKTTLNDKKESPKRLGGENRWISVGKRFLIHMIPVATTVLLVSINLSQHFIGVELDGIPDQDDEKLGALQVAAKVHELLILASLSVVVFEAVLYELVFGQGLPLGLMGAGFSFSSVGYFLSRDFWVLHFFDACQRPRQRRWGLLILLLIGGLMGLLAGPASAVLMVPRELDWPVGGAYIWLNGTNESLWPNTLAGSMIKSPIYDELGSWVTSEASRGRSFAIRQRKDFRRIHLGPRTFGEVFEETWVLMPDHEVHGVQHTLFDIWYMANEYLSRFYTKNVRFGRASSRTSSVESKLPAVRVSCMKKIQEADGHPAFNGTLEFPVLFQSENLKPPPSGSKLLAFNVSAAVNKALREMSNLAAGGESESRPSPYDNVVTMVSVQLPEVNNQSASLGIVFVGTSSASPAIKLLACSADSYWATGKSIVKLDRIPDDSALPIDDASLNWRLDLDGAFRGPSTFSPSNDGAWPWINLTAAWFDSVVPELPHHNAGRMPSFGNSTESDATAAAPATGIGYLPRELTSVYIRDMELGLSTLLADSISRTMTHVRGNIGALPIWGPFSGVRDAMYSTEPGKFDTLWSDNSELGVIGKDIVRSGPPKELPGQKPEQGADLMTTIEVGIEVRGFVMAAVGWFDYLSIVLLLIHVVIALADLMAFIWVRGVRGKAGQGGAWESIPELLALALNSEPPTYGGEDGLENTCAGIEGFAALRKIGWIESSRASGSSAGGGYGTEQLELRFGKGHRTIPNGHQRDPETTPSPGTVYGKR
ncbi:hypothetical protein QBC40DRAFT_324459 [Triangularia verruculosa]|uniref:Uncharacterized protein n=1 Tax=Triangularia verruculosa TaxID=2587418 RepID=A0AAN6XJA3_9PEZI|nr:hypothetical protein QBC40DRAFT_324459 [Triangularia verruculosa]